MTARLRIAIAVIVAASVAACATSPPASREQGGGQTNITIEQDVGFTITEDVRVPAAVRAIYEQAMALLRGNDGASPDPERTRQGIALLNEVIGKAPDVAAPYIDLAIAEQRVDAFEAAIGHLERAVELSPRHPIALNELGIAYRRVGRFTEARRSYEEALAVYPGFHHARRNLAILCDLYIGDLECALENYEAYMATVHTDDEASVWITDIRARLGRSE